MSAILRGSLGFLLSRRRVFLCLVGISAKWSCEQTDEGREERPRCQWSLHPIIQNLFPQFWKSVS